MNQNLHVNKTNFYMKGFALGLALKEKRKKTRKSPCLPNQYQYPKRQSGKKSPHKFAHLVNFLKRVCHV